MSIYIGDKEIKDLKIGTTTPSAVYLGDTKVRPSGWKPGANTLLYLPLESDVVDKSGNNRTTSATSVTFTTVGGVPSAHVSTRGGISVGPNGFVNNTMTEQTISCWYYVTSQQTSKRRCICEFAINGTNYFSIALKESTTIIQYSDSYSWVGSGTTIIANQWNNVIVTGNTTTRNIYINGSLAWTGSAGSYNPPRGSWPSTSQNGQYVMCSRDGPSGSEGLNGNAREFILENKMWNAADVSSYYTQIKSKLGI